MLLYQNTNGRSIQTSPSTATVPSSVFFAQLLPGVAADSRITALFAGTDSTGEEDEQLRCAITSKLQQLTVLLTGLTSAQDQADTARPLSCPSKHVSLLRSAVLVTDLATLTFSVKADLLCTLAHPEMPNIFALPCQPQLLESLAVQRIRRGSRSFREHWS